MEQEVKGGNKFKNALVPSHLLLPETKLIAIVNPFKQAQVPAGSADKVTKRLFGALGQQSFSPLPLLEDDLDPSEEEELLETDAKLVLEDWLEVETDPDMLEEDSDDSLLLETDAKLVLEDWLEVETDPEILELLLERAELVSVKTKLMLGQASGGQHLQLQSQKPPEPR